MLFNFKRITKKRKKSFFLCKYGMTRFYAPWSQCCAHFVFMCAPLISRDGQQQSRGVNSCIRVLIIAVMRSLLLLTPLTVCRRRAHPSPSSLKSTETTKKRASVRAHSAPFPHHAAAAPPHR